MHCCRLHLEWDVIGQSADSVQYWQLQQAILQALGYSAMGAVANWGVKRRAQQHSQ